MVRGHHPPGPRQLIDTGNLSDATAVRFGRVDERATATVTIGICGEAITHESVEVTGGGRGSVLSVVAIVGLAPPAGAAGTTTTWLWVTRSPPGSAAAPTTRTADRATDRRRRTRRRSPRRPGWRLTFRACSGAKVADVVSGQLPAVTAGTDFVTVTVGGNDVNFAPVLTECAKPSWWGNCSKAINDALVILRTQLPARLAGLYCGDPGTGAVCAGGGDRVSVAVQRVGLQPADVLLAQRGSCAQRRDRRARRAAAVAGCGGRIRIRRPAAGRSSATPGATGRSGSTGCRTRS